MRFPLASLALAIPLTLALAACGGSLKHGGSGGGDDAGGVLGALEDSGTYDPGAGQTSFSSSQVQAALATCNDPHGPAVAVTTADDESALLAGAWVLCPGGPSVTTVFSPGMILAPGGGWTRLDSDGNGGLVALQGVQNQGQWSAYCEASSDIQNDQPCIFGGQEDVGVSIHASSQDLTTNGCYGGSINFESSPRRMYVVDFPAASCDVNSTIGTFDLWLVPLGP